MELKKKVGFPQMATIHSLPNPHGYGQCAAVRLYAAARGYLGHVHHHHHSLPPASGVGNVSWRGGVMAMRRL